MSDDQCSFNQKCCPNKCGSTSCAQASAINTGSDGGYKGSSSTYIIRIIMYPTFFDWIMDLNIKETAHIAYINNVGNLSKYAYESLTN